MNLKRICAEHRKSLLKISARVVLGSSVIRVFQKHTKLRVKAILENIDVEELLKIETPEEYQQWFEAHLSRIAKEIRAANSKSTTPRIYPGYKWGHFQLKKKKGETLLAQNVRISQ